jgi:hypothetical protein
MCTDAESWVVTLASTKLAHQTRLSASVCGAGAASISTLLCFCCSLSLLLSARRASRNCATRQTERSVSSQPIRQPLHISFSHCEPHATVDPLNNQANAYYAIRRTIDGGQTTWRLQNFVSVQKQDFFLTPAAAARRALENELKYMHA